MHIKHIAKTLTVLALITAQAHGMNKDSEAKKVLYVVHTGGSELEDNAVVYASIFAAATSAKGSFSEAGKNALTFAAALAVTRKLLETDAARRVLGCASNVPVIGVLSRSLAAPESTSRTVLEAAVASAILFGLQKKCQARTNASSSN